MSPAASVLAWIWCFFRWQSVALVKSEIKGLMFLDFSMLVVLLLELRGSRMGAIVEVLGTGKYFILKSLLILDGSVVG
jgi:hypothetical protein